MRRSRYALLAVAFVSLCAHAQAAVTKPKNEEHPPRPFPILKDYKWGLMDVSGKVILTPKCAYMGEPSNGMVWYTEKEDGPVGYIDYEGKVAISPRYSIAHEFSEDRAWASNEGKATNDFTFLSDGMYGVIDKTGKFIVEPMHFIKGTPFHEGLSLVVPGVVKGTKGPMGMWLIDSRGKLRATIKPLRPYTLSEWSEGFMPVFDKRERPTGILSSRRGTITSTQAGYIDSRYRLVFTNFEKTRPFSEGLAAVQKKNQKWGYINKNGQVAIPQRFELATEFSEGVAAVVLSGDPGREGERKKATWGFIDKRGNAAGRSLEAALVWPYKDGVAVVMLERSPDPLTNGRYGKFAIIDKQGERVFEIDNARIEPFEGGLAMVRIFSLLRTGKVGYVDKTGKWVREPTE